MFTVDRSISNQKSVYHVGPFLALVPDVNFIEK